MMKKKSLNGVEKEANESNGCLATLNNEEVPITYMIYICIR